MKSEGDVIRVDERNSDTNTQKRKPKGAWKFQAIMPTFEHQEKIETAVKRKMERELKKDETQYGFQERVNILQAAIEVEAELKGHMK